MAQVAVTAGAAVASGVAGGIFGGPAGALLGAQLGALAGSIIGGIFFPGGSTTPGPVVGDLKVQAASYGKSMPLLIGTSRVSGEIINMSDLIPTAVTTTVGAGMGFGTPQQGVAAYTYSITMAVSFGIPLMGPAVGITRIWADGKKIHDSRPNGAHASLRGATLRKYLGSATQLPDPWIQSKEGADICSAYRGQVYIVLEHLQLADFANHPPNITAEVVCAGSPAYPYQLITPTSYNGGIVINSDLGIIVKYGPSGQLVTIDTQTLAIVAGPTTPLAANNYPVFGSDGYFYSDGDVAGGRYFNYHPWVKVDPTSLQVVQTIGFEGVFDDSNHDGLGFANYMKCRDYPYILGCCGTSLPSFSEVGATIISTGQLEALAAGTPTSGDLPMRFVGKTQASGGPDPFCQDWEIDALSLSNSIAAGSLPITFDLWGVYADTVSGTCTLYRFVVTDNFIPGGGTTVGGAFGANSIVLADTIDLTSAWSVFGQPYMTYMDDGEHALIICRDTKVIKFNLDSLTVTGAELEVGGVPISMMQQGPSDGLLYCGNGGAILNILDVLNWDIQETVNLANYGGATLVNPQWDERNGTLWVGGVNVEEIWLDAVQSSEVVLGDAVKALCELGGLTAAQLDTSDLTDSLYGYTVPRQCSIRDAIKPLADAFLFEAYEADFKLKFAKLGSSTVAAALTYDEIGAYAESANRPEPLAITDTNQRQIPRRVTVRYIDPTAGTAYGTGLQAAQRHQPIVTTVSELNIDAPVVMYGDDAQNVAEAWLERTWVNARKLEFAVSSEYLGLTPTDIATVVDLYGNSYQVAIKQIDAGADGTFKITALREDPESYVPAAPAGAGAGVGGSPNPGGGGGGPNIIGHTDAELMDIILIMDSQDGEGFYLAMAPDTGDPSSWLGGVLMVSTDNGNSFTALETLTKAANMGRATTALPAPPGGRWTTWDRVNTVTVRLFDPTADTLSSTSEINVLNGANLCVLGNELIAFANVVNNGDGTFTLSDLLRALRGSDPFIGTHTIGDRFVMVDFTVWADILPDPNFGALRVFKTQSIGDTTIPATSQLFTDTGLRLMPLSAQGPVISASGSDLVIAWNRRTRIGGENEWGDAISTTPLGEATESYQVDIIKAGTPVRTLSTAAPNITYDSEGRPTVTYPAADQVTDFGSDQTSVEVEIYQMSAIVGRGFGLDAVLSLP